MESLTFSSTLPPPSPPPPTLPPLPPTPPPAYTSDASQESRNRRGKMPPPPPPTTIISSENKKKRRYGESQELLNKRLKNNPPYEEVVGDILKMFHTQSTAVIVQINNCVARRAHYNTLTWHLSQLLPYSDPYSARKGVYPNLANKDDRPELGTVELRRPPADFKEAPTFACFFSQYRMGNTDSQYYENAKYVDEEYLIKSKEKDTYSLRLLYFATCLHTLYSLLKEEENKKFTKVVFPKYIGCGLAGGNWDHYEKLIVKFCSKLKLVRNDIEVIVVKKI